MYKHAYRAWPPDGWWISSKYFPGSRDSTNQQTKLHMKHMTLYSCMRQGSNHCVYGWWCHNVSAVASFACESHCSIVFCGFSQDSVHWWELVSYRTWLSSRLYGHRQWTELVWQGWTASVEMEVCCSWTDDGILRLIQPKWLVRSPVTAS